jgi:hypothetical protein
VLLAKRLDAAANQLIDVGAHVSLGSRAGTSGGSDYRCHRLPQQGQSC